MDAREDLTDRQKQIVTATESNILIVAAAGSGKTRVLTHRIAHLVESGQSPASICAITFTRKAANVMRQRLITLLGEKDAASVNVGTIHALAVQIIRRWSRVLGLRPGFSIYDDDDMEVLEQQVAEDMGVKNAGKGLGDIFLKEIHRRLRRYNAIPLRDLIRSALTILEDTGIRDRLRNELRFFLVDEFQDVDIDQADLIGSLADDNFFAVGDDWQAIYAFRGANVQIMLDYAEHPKSTVYRLEWNFRSERPIVMASNELISHNKSQIHKSVHSKTYRPNDVPIVAHAIQPLSWVIERIQRMLAGGTIKPEQIGVLCRKRRPLITLKLLSSGAGFPIHSVDVANEIWGSQEMKDFVAHLSLAVNPRDDSAAWRVLRGLSKLERAQLEEYAVREHKSLYEAYLAACDGASTYAFCEPQGRMRTLMPTGSITGIEHLATVFLSTLGHLQLIKWFDENPGNGAIEFLQWYRTRHVQDAMPEKSEAVTFATIHAAKGLEWDYVFLIGMEEGTTPARQNLPADQMEEERRVVYVGMTRAAIHLYMVTSPTDIYSRKDMPPSRFIAEMGALQEIQNFCERAAKIKEVLDDD
jgi:superfamily I DNA/RNA helicase